VRNRTDPVGVSVDAHCMLCAVGSPKGRDHAVFGDSIAIPCEDFDAVLLLGLDPHHVGVVPAAHVAQLSALPSADMAHVLAALRRVALRKSPHGGAVRLRAVDTLGSSGHVCIRVGPVGDPGVSDADRGAASAPAERLDSRHQS
jgi:hypothetical protein